VVIFVCVELLSSFGADPKSSTENESEYTNHLINEKSPYLLQHAHNPVDWYPWGEEAFATARKENKPIFLSVGYSTCHWCHVMERESYSDPEIAVIMNANFVSVKVDREERPDVDNIYMTFVEATNRERRLAHERLADSKSQTFCRWDLLPCKGPGRPTSF